MRTVRELCERSRRTSRSQDQHAVKGSLVILLWERLSVLRRVNSVILVDMSSIKLWARKRLSMESIQKLGAPNGRSVSSLCEASKDTYVCTQEQSTYTCQ